MAFTGQRIAMVDMVFLVFYSISTSTVGVDGPRVCLPQSPDMVYKRNLCPSGSFTENMVAKTFARYRGHLDPSDRELQIEFENGFPGPFGPGAQKVQNGVEKESEIAEK